MIDKFQALAELGAGEFEHIDSLLIDHLTGTKRLLEQWGATTALHDAGLYHAAYGTAAFTQHLISIDQRDKIRSIIGEVSEDIVYQYCACDRKTFFARIGKESHPEFPNRFTGESYFLSSTMLCNFCELTAANEVEIATNNAEFVNQYGNQLAALFSGMAPYLTSAAQNMTAEVFGG